MWWLQAHHSYQFMVNLPNTTVTFKECNPNWKIQLYTGNFAIGPRSPNSSHQSLVGSNLNSVFDSERDK